jgi:hypothetical protein
VIPEQMATGQLVASLILYIIHSIKKSVWFIDYGIKLLQNHQSETLSNKSSKNGPLNSESRVVELSVSFGRLALKYC